MPALDTNLLLRFLLQDHPVQSRQVADMIQAARVGSFEVADVAIFECVWVMQGSSYNLDRHMIGELLAELLRVEQINCNRGLVERIIPLYTRHRSVSFIDIGLAVYAELNGAGPVLTFDRKLAKTLPGLVKALP